MKLIAILLVGIQLTLTVYAQSKREQSFLKQAEFCGGVDELTKLKGKWTKVEDAEVFADKTLPKSQFKQVHERIDKMVELFKEAIPDLSATEARWYRGMRGGSYTVNGPVPYSLNSVYYNYYCSENLKKIFLNDETFTWFHIFVNHYNWFCTKLDDWDINNDGKMIVVYYLPPKAGQWKGVTLYEPDTHRGYSRAIVIGHNGKLPWHTLTQKQFLTGLRNDLEAKKKKALSFNYQKVEYRNNAEKYWDEKLKPVNDYLSSHTDEDLKQPAYIDRGAAITDFRGRFGEESTGVKLVAFSSAYWNKDLPRYAPQFMILYWMWDSYPLATPIKKQFEENLDISKLRALIDK
jgi:hypothetical protein